MATLKRMIWRMVGRSDYSNRRTLARWVSTAIGACWSSGATSREGAAGFCARARWHSGDRTTT